MNRERVQRTDSVIGRSESLDLARAVDELTRRVLNGEVIDFDQLCIDYPEFVDQLQDLMPAIRAVADLSLSSQAASNFQLDGAVGTRMLGDFRILREIGRGGMGVVYEAEQITLGRQVAVKVLPFTGMLSTQQLQRFKNEAHVAASLHHPNIVNAFFVGQERGVHFFAMQYVEGKSLAQVVAEFTRSDREDPITPVNDVPNSNETVPRAALSTERDTNRRKYNQSIARLGIQAADALGYAHSMGIVHRDIKPSNLLIDHDANLWITDFGLASTQTDVTVTMTGDLLGTLRYMSPEQASGNRDFVDHRTDIYSLGVTLYELLTGQPAIQGNDRVEIVRNFDNELVPPNVLDPNIPKDLNNIILKATSQRREDRYDSALEFKEDLQCFLDQRPVKARRISRLQRTIHWAKRSPKFAALAAISIVLAVVLSIGGPWLALALQQKVNQLDLQNHSLALARAFDHWNKNQLAEVQHYLNSVDPKDGDSILGFEYYHLAGRLQRALDLPTGHHGSPVPKVIFSPDGKQVVSSCDDGVIRFWNPDDLTLTRAIEAHDGEILWIEYSPDEKLLVSASMDRSVKLWSAETMTMLKKFEHQKAVRQAGFSPDGKIFATLESPGQPTLSTLENDDAGWNRSNVIVAERNEPGGGFCFSPDSKNLITFNRYTGALVYRIGVNNSAEYELSNVRQLPLTWPQVEQVAFSESGTHLVTVGTGLEVWDTKTWSLQNVLASEINCSEVVFAENDSRLITAGIDPIRIWDPARKMMERQIPAHLQGITSLSIAPNGSSLIASCREGTIRRFSIDSNPQRDAIEIPAYRFLTLCAVDEPAAQMHHAAVLVSRHDETSQPTLDLIDLNSGRRTPLERSNRAYFGLATNLSSPEIIAVGGGKRGAADSSSSRGVVDLWNLRMGEKIWSPPTEIAGWVLGIAFSNSGHYLALSGTRGGLLGHESSLEVWDLKSHKRIHRSTDHVGMSLAFSKDDKHLIVGGGDWNHGICYVLRTEFWDAEDSFAVHTQVVMQSQFSRSGDVFAASNKEGAFSVLSWPKCELLIDSPRFRNDIAFLAIASDERTVAVAAGRALEFWRTDTGQQVGSLPTPEPVANPRFTPDGQRLVWVGINGSLHIWHRDGRTEVIPVIESPMSHASKTEKNQRVGHDFHDEIDSSIDNTYATTSWGSERN